MKNKLFLMIPFIALSLTNIDKDSSKNAYKVYANSAGTTKITQSELNWYIDNKYAEEIYTVKGIDGKYNYVRYDLFYTRTFGDVYFLNIQVKHNASLADTILTLSSFSFIGLSYTKGFGFSTEASIPGSYSSYSSDIALTTSSNYTISEEASYILYGDKNKDNVQYFESGNYYVYHRESFVDSIIVKYDNSRRFISAEYYSSVPEDALNLVFMKTRPTTSETFLPTC